MKASLGLGSMRRVRQDKLDDERWSVASFMLRVLARRGQGRHHDNKDQG